MTGPQNMRGLIWGVFSGGNLPRPADKAAHLGVRAQKYKRGAKLLQSICFDYGLQGRIRWRLGSKFDQKQAHRE